MKNNPLITIMLAITIGLLSWIAIQTHHHGQGLAVLMTEMTSVKERLSSTVSEREFNLRLAGIETQIAELKLRLATLESKRP